MRLDRPERKNPLTFDSYAELRDWFRTIPYTDEIQAVVIAPNGGNFSSGGDVHEIIGPLTKMDMKELLAFTRMTGDLIKAMINCGKPIISAVQGISAGRGQVSRSKAFHPLVVKLACVPCCFSILEAVKVRCGG